jgi:hypothetical protein
LDFFNVYAAFFASAGCMTPEASSLAALRRRINLAASAGFAPT